MGAFKQHAGLFKNEGLLRDELEEDGKELEEAEEEYFKDQEVFEE
jgi:hypothetical protein